MDNGFRSIFTVSLSADLGRLYENAAFLNLRRTSREIYYFLGNQEVDFYCRTDSDMVVANVSLDIRNPETRTRELNGLVEALEFFDCHQGLLLTRDHEETLDHKRKTILIQPLWKWSLKGG